MRPPQWTPPIELSKAEQKVAQRIRKAKLFVFVRHVRHELFNAEFQQELTHIFKGSTVGKCPVAPAQIALAIISTCKKPRDLGSRHFWGPQLLPLTIQFNHLEDS